MATITNKEFGKLLNTADYRTLSIGEIEITHESNEDFYFTYYVNDNSIAQSDIELSEGQEKFLKAVAQEYHKDNQIEIESEDAFENTQDYYSEYGINNQMFI